MAAPMASRGAPGGGGFTIPGYSPDPVYVQFADTTGNQFANVRVFGAIDWQTFANTAGNMVIDTLGDLEGNGHVSIGGNLYVSQSGVIEPEAVELFGVLADTGFFAPDTTLFSGTSQTMPSYPVACLRGQ